MHQDEGPKAIPFIVKNNQGIYQLTQQAENLINSINTPISIVTVAGLYRTGKSFLLNRVILNKSRGFNVGPTVNPCTKGLWIWNQPIYTADNINVLVIDTEGLGALDQQTNHDTKIFCLAVLLSTTFIYNSVGSIDQGALQNLSLVLNLVNNIDQDQQSNRPSFIWVVRDFSLQLINQKGISITSQQYLQMALSTDIVKETQKVAIRNTITKAFQQRDCFTLYKPLIDQTKLQNLDNVPLDDLRPQFVTQTMILRKKLFSTLKQFKLNNCSNFKGSEYILMTKKYIEAINDGKVPNMTDTWTFIKQQKSRQVLQNLQQMCLQKVNSKLIPKLPLKQQNLKQILNQLYSQLLHQFQINTYPETSPKDLQSFWEKILRQILNSNQEQRKQTLRNIFNKQYQSFCKKLNSYYYNEYEEFTTDLRNNFKSNLINIYGQKIDNFQQSLQIFYQKKNTQGLKVFFNKQKLEIKNLLQFKNQIQTNYDKQFKDMQNHSNNQRKLLKNQISEIQKTLLQKQQQKNTNQRQIMTKQAQFQIQKQKLKAQKDQIKNILEGAKQQVQAYHSKNQQIEKNYLTVKKQLQKERALYIQKQEHFQSKLYELQAKYKHAKIQQQVNGGRYESQRKGIMANFQQKMKDLLKQNKSKSQRIFQLQNLTEQFKEQNQKLKQIIFEIQNKFQTQKKQIKQKLTTDMSNKKQSFSFQLEESKKEMYRVQQSCNRLVMENKQTQIKYKQLLDQIKQVKSNNEKQIAIHLQKIQFQQFQINQLKTTNQELKRSYQKAMDAIQDCSKNNQNKYQVRLVQATQQHERQMKKIQKQCQQRFKQYKNQIYVLNKQREDLQIELSIQRNKAQAKQKQFKQSYHKMELNYQNLSKKYTSSEKDYKDISHQKQTLFVIKINQLQTQLQANKEKYNKEFDQSRRTSEQALAVLKNYAELQRQQAEKRLTDQRQKFKKKIKSQMEEMDKRMGQQKLSMEEQISMLMQKLMCQQKFYTQKVQNMQYDYDIQIQKIVNQFGEQKVQLNKRNALLNQQIQMTKKNLQNKLQENARSYQQRQVALKNQLENEYEQGLLKLKQDRQFVQQKYENLKKANRQTEQSNLMLKNDLDKQRSIFKQKQHNHLKQINDLQSRLSSQIISHNRTMQEYTISTQTERAKLNSQINQLKMSKSKLQQQKSTMQISFEQQKITYNVRVSYLETRYRGKQEDYNDLMNKFQVTTNYLSKNNQNLTKQLNSLKTKLQTDFQAKLKIKEQEFKKNMKQLQERIMRFQSDNKSLRDKIIMLQMQLSSKNQHDSQYSSQQIEQMREQYERKIQEMRMYIDKLKKEIKNHKKQKQIMELNQGLNQSKLTSKDFRNQRSERQSIINGLHQNNQFSRSRLQDDFSKSKINPNQLSRVNYNQAEGKRLSFLTQNKNLVNIKGQTSQQVTANKYQRRTQHY